MNMPLGLSRLPRGLWYAAAAIGAAALILIGVLLFVHARKIESSRQSVSQLTSRADRAISRGSYPAASSYLDQAMKTAQTRDSWMSIAKRAYAIATATNNYGLLLHVARKGTENLPGSQELWALRVLAQARSGDPAGAESVAHAHLTDTRYQSFGTEAALRAHPDLNLTGSPAAESTRKLVETLTSRDPALFENLANAIDSPGLLFDAALLYAWKGDLTAAYTLLVSLGKETNPEAGMLISYDSGKFDSARSYFEGMQPTERTPGLELLSDDLYVLQGEYGKAAAAYLRFVKEHPSLSWSPYVDLAWLAGTGQAASISVAQAISLLRTASQHFPDQREVALSLATLERRSGDLASARAELSHFLSRHPQDIDAGLLFLQLSQSSGNQARARSRLWELFYRASGEEKDRVARYLAWYLLGLNDREGINLIFNQMKGKSDGGWIPFYRGIYDALTGDYSASVAELQKADTVDPQWQTLYNIGLVKLRQGDPKGAVGDLQKADSLLSSETGSPSRASPAGAAASSLPRARERERAGIHVALATAFARMGNPEAAKREVLYAQDLDPNNLEAALLRKKLDSAGQR